MDQKTEQKRTQETNSLQILAKAAEAYLKSLDELAHNFTAPQIQAAVRILSNLIEEHYTQAPQGAQSDSDPSAP